MIRRAAKIVGIVFLAIGILGFIPGITMDHNGMKMLLGIFMVDAPNNIVHVLSGIVLVVAARTEHWSRLALQVMGVV